MMNIVGTAAAIAADTLRTRGRGLKNGLARRHGQRLVVFESDDWGSQRVPSRAVMTGLIADGLISGDNPYDRDTLESARDIETLSDILSSVRDAGGNHAVFTCYANPANPDFDAIRGEGFEHYIWEPVTATHDRRGDRREAQAAWRAAIQAGLMVPEFHGREHLHVGLWMKYLHSSPMVRAGFDRGFYSVPEPALPPPAKGFRAACFFTEMAEVPEIADIIMSGADCFKTVFGRAPSVFCPTNNIFHPLLYPVVRAAGCRAVIRHARNLQPDGRGGVRSVWGKRGVAAADLAWFGRNAIFEPALGYGVEHALRGISSAFAWGVPAIIATHRLNYVGGIEPSVRDNGARTLRTLLDTIVRRWPDVRFASSTELIEDKAEQ